MSAVGTQYANSEDRKVDRKAESSLSLWRSVPLSLPHSGGGEGREENEGLGYRSTPSLMFMSNPSQTRRGAGGPKSVTNQTCSGGETKRRSGSQIKRALLRGQRVSARYKSKQLRQWDGGWNKSRWPHLVCRLSECEKGKNKKLGRRWAWH